MFFFNRIKRDKPPPLINDLHSHLIPRIDDGSQSLSESLEILTLMSDLGYKKIITTPHVMADTYRNSTKTILDGYKQLQHALIKEGIDIDLQVAAEYYLDELFDERLDADDILTLGDNYLLFETSYIAKPINFELSVFKMRAKGYTPLLAHPERYRYIKNPKAEYTKMKEMGISFQLDTNSLGGHYGKEAYGQAILLSKWGMIDFLGSDIHHKKQVNFLRDVFEKKEYYDLWESNSIKNEFL